MKKHGAWYKRISGDKMPRLQWVCGFASSDYQTFNPHHLLNYCHVWCSAFRSSRDTLRSPSCRSRQIFAWLREYSVNGHKRQITKPSLTEMKAHLEQASAVFRVTVKGFFSGVILTGSYTSVNLSWLFPILISRVTVSLHATMIYIHVCALYKVYKVAKKVSSYQIVNGTY